ncbi:hypothetical protein BcDW1_3926 [Botrytis cinerea BcDW1]|uniref:Uncharacterized protein n=1 Tax=Botryotinia fuckeliana (strain BcDW1) TaxID=1290391 RepID=M7UKU1_BOTF1|nr:hypothetical protein BcDW1_3926 [Botrytis cinerea BcDW1]
MPACTGNIGLDLVTLRSATAMGAFSLRSNCSINIRFEHSASSEISQAITFVCNVGLADYQIVYIISIE